MHGALLVAPFRRRARWLTENVRKTVPHAARGADRAMSGLDMSDEEHDVALSDGSPWLE
jgi:hypothetical protein